jgi:hypothetical protein
MDQIRCWHKKVGVYCAVKRWTAGWQRVVSGGLPGVGQDGLDLDGPGPALIGLGAPPSNVIPFPRDSVGSDYTKRSGWDDEVH